MNIRGGKTNTSGFTIVELLIVVVVIAILAAITIVSYNGIANQSKDTALQATVRDFAMSIEEYNAVNGQYPTKDYGDLDTLDFKINKNAIEGVHNNQDSPIGYNFGYCVNTARTQFVIHAISPSGKVFQYVQGSGLRESAWINGGYAICEIVGMTSTNPSWGYTYNPAGDSWRSWVQ